MDRNIDDKNKTKAQFLDEITNLRKSVAELEIQKNKYLQSEETLIRITNSIEDVIYSVDRQTQEFTYLSPAFERLLGYTMTDVQQMGGRRAFLAKVIEEKQFDQQVVEFENLRSGKKSEVSIWEAWWRCKDGSLVCLEDRWIPIYTENGLFSTDGVLRDVTKRKQIEIERERLITELQSANANITEQKLIETALKRERNLLRVLIDNLPDVIYVKDVNCRKTISNLADVHVMGLQSETEAIGKDDFELFPKELAEKFYADDKSVIQTGQPILNREEYVFNEQGRKSWIVTSKLPLRDEKGQIIGLIGIGKDITYRKQTEEALQRERNLLRTLIDNLPDAVYVKDDQCRKTIANLADVHNMGLQSEAEALGKNDFELFSKELAEGFYADDQTVIQTGKSVSNREEYVINEQGKKRWLSTSKIPLRDEKGEIIGIVGIGINITERKHAEDALKQERNLLRTLIDNAPELIVYKDAETKYLLNNRAHLRFLGVKHQEDVLGKTAFDFHAEEVAKQYYEEEMQLVHTGEPIINREEIALHKDTNEQRWHITSKIPLKDDQGKVTSFIVISHDITERKQAEIERERTIAELKSAIAAIKTLRGLVPICASCKKIRDDKGYWTQVEAYIQERSQARFSHGICPDCMNKMYPNFVPKEKE